jgi:hypothetical protein
MALISFIMALMSFCISPIMGQLIPGAGDVSVFGGTAVSAKAAVDKPSTADARHMREKVLMTNLRVSRLQKKKNYCIEQG